MFGDDVYDDANCLNHTHSLYISITSVLQFHLTLYKLCTFFCLVKCLCVNIQNDTFYNKLLVDTHFWSLKYTNNTCCTETMGYNQYAINSDIIKTPCAGVHSLTHIHLCQCTVTSLVGGKLILWEVDAGTFQDLKIIRLDGSRMVIQPISEYRMLLEFGLSLVSFSG